MPGDGSIPSWEWSPGFAAWDPAWDAENHTHPWAGYGWDGEGHMAGWQLTHWYPTTNDDWGWWDWDPEHDQPTTADGAFGFNQAIDGLIEWYPVNWSEADEDEFIAALDEAIRPSSYDDV